MGEQPGRADPLALVDALAQTWASTAEACEGLTEPQWLLPTGCPGWSVQDNVAHLSGLELQLMGRPDPPHEVPAGLAHVRDDLGRFMEASVDYRRSWGGERVLEEFRAVTADRLAGLRAITDFSGDTAAPFGGRWPWARALAIRVFDSYAHEQDIRRALGRRGNDDAPAAAIARDRILQGLAHGLLSQVPELGGRVVLLDITGPAARQAWLVFDEVGGRVSDGEVGYDVRLSLNSPDLLALGCGRSDADPGAAVLDGDVALGQRVVGCLGVTP